MQRASGPGASRAPGRGGEPAEAPLHREHDPAVHWSLDPDVTYLNHGSFGACPRPVLAAQQRLRDRLEREPTRFFRREAPALLARAREAVACFVGAEADDLVFVPNVTTALNSVLRSFPFGASDEMLVTDHAYNAARNAADHAARAGGARVVVARVPFPLRSPHQVVEAVLAAVGPRTRLALLDHVTSQTGLVLPLELLVPELQARSVEVLVDGAHAPGMLPVDLGRLGAEYYAGNCHKWLCAPKGAGFLVVRRDLRERVRPAVISHGANAPVAPPDRFRLEFEWTGTADPTPALSVPDALRFLGSLLPGGWPELMHRNRALVLEGRRVVAAALGVDLPCPDAMIGSLAALPVPERSGLPRAAASVLDLDPLQETLFRDHRIEVPVFGCPAQPGRLLRISAQLYNRIEDYQRLAAALGDLLRQGAPTG